MVFSLNHIILEIDREEKKISLSATNAIDEAYQMMMYLKEYLLSIREDVIKQGFKNNWEEINFFHNIKPYILSKLIYHNKIFRIHTSCLVDGGKMYVSYFSEQLQGLKQKYKEHIYYSDFYRYYGSGKTYCDETYFRLNNINFHNGLNSFAFEIDPLFSTYYDNKVARIIANELLYSYIIQKINDEQAEGSLSARDLSSGNILWTDTKNALTELIYALYANGSISYGKLGIRKISFVLERLFQITLRDSHHSFHLMKYRTASRTTFLDQLKSSLEE